MQECSCVLAADQKYPITTKQLLSYYSNTMQLFSVFPIHSQFTDSVLFDLHFF